MKTDNISFGAIPISKTTVKKYNKLQKQFTSYPVNFVKIDACNKDDLNAIYETAQKWNKIGKPKYAQLISTSCQWMKDKPIRVYALTIQKNNLEKLQPDCILALAEMRFNQNNPQNTLLNYLQVRPNAKYVNQKHKINYKYVGSAMLESLKGIYKEFFLFADNDKNVEAFYKRNGFIDDFDGTRHYAWSSNFFKRLLLRIRKFRFETGI